MDPLLVPPYEHLAGVLAKFTGSMRSSQPAVAAAGAARWSRVVQQLEQDLRQLRSHHGSSGASATVAAEHEALKRLALRLTQLARTQDGLRFEQSAAVPEEQLLGERRLIVLAAWQLQHALEQIAATPRTAGPTTEAAAAR